MDHKAAETTHNINQTSGQELLRNRQGSSVSRRFAKEMRVWKMRSTVAGHWKLTMTD